MVVFAWEFRFLRTLTSALFFLIPALAALSQENPYQRYLWYKSTLSAAPLAGKEAIKGRYSFETVLQLLEKRKLSVETLDFPASRENHPEPLRVLTVLFPGKTSNLCVLALPLPGNGVPDGVPLILSLSEEWQREIPPVTLRILFLEGERGIGEGDASRWFVQTFYPPSSTLVLYLSVTQIPAPLEILTGTRGMVTPALPLSLFLDSFPQTGLPLLLPGNRNQLYRLHVPVSLTPLGPYLRARMAILGLRDIPEPFRPALPQETETWVRQFRTGLSIFLQRYASLDFSTRDPEWDTHYLVMQHGSRFLLIGETTIVAVLLGIIGISCIVGFFRKEHTVRYLRTLLRNAWNLPLYFGILFLFLTAGTWAFKLVEGNRATLWQTYPLPTFLLKLSVTTFLFTLSFHVLHRLPLSKRGSFYSASSMLFFFINILLFSLIDVTLSYYFLWGFFCSLCFTFFKKKRIKFFFLLLSPLGLYQITYDLFFPPELPMIRILLTSTTGNILLAFMLLPFLLMGIRIDLLTRHRSLHRPGWGIKTAWVFFGALSVGLSLYLWIAGT